MSKTQISILICLATLALSCNNSSEKVGLPICIQNLIEEDRKSDFPIIRISEQILNHASYYLLEDNLITQAETNYIYNIDCDTPCYYCSDCVLPACVDAFSIEDWIVIWEKE